MENLGNNRYTVHSFRLSDISSSLLHLEKGVNGVSARQRHSTSREDRVGKVKELRGRERRKVNQQLHILTDRIIEYARRFPKLIIVMENLNGIRSFKTKKTQHVHSQPTLQKTLNIY